MARALRIEFPGAIYHVMSRGVNRAKTFLDDRDHQLFLDRVGRFVAKGVLLIHAFSLMRNHYHILCETPHAGLHRWMQQILGPYSQRFNSRRNRVGTLWQGRYKAILVQDGLYFLNASSYIHRNASSAGICPTLDEHLWSSWGAFTGGKCPVDWVSTDRTLRGFRSPADYRDFVLWGGGSTAGDPFATAKAGIAYGDDDFLRRVLALVDERPPDPEVPSLTALRRLEHQPSVPSIKELVSGAFPDYSACQQRRIIIHVLSHHTLLTGQQIAKLTGLTPSAVTMARQAIDRKLTADAELSQGLERIRRGLEASDSARRGHAPSPSRPARPCFSD